MTYGSIQEMKQRILTLEGKLREGEEGNILRIRTLEGLIQHQSEAYVAGYVRAMKDNQLLLEDVDVDNLDKKYRAQLYTKALAIFNKVS